MPLKIAARIDEADRAYWENVIQPMVDAHDNVTFLGEIGESQKADFLGNARALLFPVDGAEPFGLPMIEAMACGTPVIAWKNGAVPEIVEPGLTGYVVETLEEAVRAVGRIDRLSRTIVRAIFEERFTADRMARDYVQIYRGLPGVETAIMPLPHMLEGHAGKELHAAE